MSKRRQGLVVHRLSQTVVCLSNPTTAKELGEHLGIFASCAYGYINGLQKGGYPIKSRIRLVGGRGKQPLEYWMDWADPIIREALRLRAELMGKRKPTAPRYDELYVRGREWLDSQ